MKYPLLLILAALPATDAVAEDQFAFGAGVSLARISGSRTYGTVAQQFSATLFYSHFGIRNSVASSFHLAFGTLEPA